MWGREAILDRTNLNDTNLKGANLHSASVQGANLTGADFGNANQSAAAGSNVAGVDVEVATNLTKANLKGANLTSANLEGANLSDAILTGVDLTNARVSATTNMTGASFSSFVARVPKAAARRNSGSAARSVLWSTLSLLACYCCKSAVGDDDDQDSDGDSDAGDEEEMEEDEADLEKELEQVIDQIACAAAVVDGALQDIVSVIKERVLAPYRQELRTVVAAKIRKIPTPPPSNRPSSMRKHQEWLQTSKRQVMECIQAESSELIRELFDDVLSTSFLELREVVNRWLDESKASDNDTGILKALGLEPYQPKKEQPSQGGPEKQQPKPVAAPAALAVNMKSDLLDKLPKPASGLNWEQISEPAALAQGRELQNSNLAAALASKTDFTFTQQEWDAFGIHKLRTNHFVQSGGRYFKPAEAAVSTNDIVEEMAADPGSALARTIRRGLVDEIVSIFDPKGKCVGKLRRQVESRAQTLATKAADKIVESISFTLSRTNKDVESAATGAEERRNPSTSAAGSSRRFKLAALTLISSNRIRDAGLIAIDPRPHLRPLEEACDSLEHFLLDEGLAGLAQQAIRWAVLTAVSMLSGAPVDMADKLGNSDTTLTSKQVFPLLSKVSLYEHLLATKLQKVQSSTFMKLMSPDSFKANIIGGMLASTTDYTMRPAGLGAYYDMIAAAVRFTRPQLAREERDLMYVIEQMEKLRELQISDLSLRDSVETWISLLDLLSQISSQRAQAVLQCLSGDKKLLSALGAGMALRHVIGREPPMGIVATFNRDVGSKIRRDAYLYLTELGQELAIVRRTREHQVRGLAFIGSAMLSVFISIGTVVGRLYYDAIKEPEDSMLLWLIPAIFCGSLLVCCLCSFAAYKFVKAPSSSSANRYRPLNQ